MRLQKERQGRVVNRTVLWQKDLRLQDENDKDASGPQCSIRGLKSDSSAQWVFEGISLMVLIC